MHYQFSPTTNISESATLAMNALALSKRAQGERVYNLSAGEPFVLTDQKIQDAAIEAIKANKTQYPPVPGIRELRNAFIEWINKTYQASFNLDEIVVTAGGKHAVQLLLQTLLSSQDEVLIIAPYWVSYPSMVHVAGGVSRIIKTQESQKWHVTATQIKEACTDKTRVLILNNAGNPTGALYSYQEIESILKIATENNLIVISDEVYSSLVYDDNVFVSCSTFDAYKDRVCVVQSMSKHVAMTGWRVGFACGPSEIIQKVIMLQSQSTSGSSSISQYAALGALTDMNNISESIRLELQQRRDVLISSFQKHDVTLTPASAGLYQFVPLSVFGQEVIDSAKWCETMLEQINVATVPGIAFGQEGFVRLSFGGSVEDIQMGIGAIYSK